MVAKQDGFAPATSKTTEKPAKSLLDTLKCPARYAKEIRAQIGHMSDKSGNRSARELVTDLSDAVILSLSQYDGKDESFSPTDLSRNILLRLRRQLHKFDDSDGVISCIDAALKETTPSQARAVDQILLRQEDLSKQKEEKQRARQVEAETNASILYAARRAPIRMQSHESSLATSNDWFWSRAMSSCSAGIHWVQETLSVNLCNIAQKFYAPSSSKSSVLSIDERHRPVLLGKQDISQSPSKTLASTTQIPNTSMFHERDPSAGS
ncbi:MAG: hypothetical protein TREMPRED_005368 [Tremellales sp. Tagirdzhanova-0007]|nr:MAG: hypothetical protein TREMPRED_005368 [Tremellales sp. Tagirdzhanova-0007]